MARKREDDIYHTIEYHFIKGFILLLLFLDVVVILALVIWHIWHLLQKLGSL